MELFNLFEDYSEYEDSRWLHYTDHEMLSVHTKRSHTDPPGIYFFSEKNPPAYSIWHQKKYKFVVIIKPNTKVLDLSKMPDDEIDRMVEAAGVKAQYEGYIKQYPPDTHVKKVDMAWEQMKNAFGFGFKWNAVLRGMGYDAVFDDAAIIHTSEPIQLLVLNPRIITIVSRDQQKANSFANMKKVMDELVAVCKPFGQVTTEGPQKKKSSWSYAPALQARVEVKRSEEVYANFNITLGDQAHNKHMINVGLSWSRPKLSYGVGANYDSAKGEWQFRGLESVQRDLNQIFNQEEGAWEAS